MTTLEVGDVEITAIRDAAWRFLPSSFTPQVPAEAWRGELGADPLLEVESRVLCFLVRSDEGTLLVDSGVGQWGLWRFGDGVLLDALGSAHVHPDDIAFVVPTHMHADHVGGCMRPTPAGPVPNFPNARYVFQRADWEYFSSAAFISGPSGPNQSVVRQGVLPLADLGLVDVVLPGHRLTACVDIMATPGHTPGSCTVRVRSGGATALIIGDAAHHQAQIANPDWSSAYDADADAAKAARRRISEEAVRSDAMVASSHFGADSPIFAPIRVTDVGYRWAG